MTPPDSKSPDGNRRGMIGSAAYGGNTYSKSSMSPIKAIT